MKGWRIDMQKSFLGRNRQYIALTLILLFTALGIFSVYNDIRDNAIKISMSSLSDNASLFTRYFDDMMQIKTSNLEQLSKKIDDAMMQDTANMESTISSYYRYFSSIAVLDSKGNLKYGEKIDFDMSEEEIFGQVVYGKQTIVHSEIVCDSDNRESIVVCTPIEEKGKTIGILQGMVYISELNDFLERWEYARKDSTFLMTEDGEYVSDTEMSNKTLGKESESFYEYLTNCDMKGEIASSSDTESTVMKRQLVSLQYRINGKDYVGILTPSGYGKWYIGYISNIDYFKNAFSVSKSTWFLIVIALFLWVCWIAMFIYLTYQNSKKSAELDRYTLIHQQSHSLIFDFQFSPKRLEFFGDVKEMFGYEPHVLRGEEVYDVYQYVHQDDASVRGRIHRFYDDDSLQFAAEVRIRNINDEYGWYRISGTLVKDERWGINRRFIGKIENADQQIAKEKNLVQRSENDLLTGILNKTTMEEKVTQCLENIQGSYHYIFFMVDLDNFKNVNDNLGHIIGDKAIVDTANKLKEVFQNNAFIGRLGGDEFAVCVAYDAFDEESLFHYIRTKAEKICEVNRRTYVNGEKKVDITSSVGIAVAPDFAQDFETIYKMADQALYRSKNGGKNCYHIYEESK